MADDPMARLDLAAPLAAVKSAPPIAKRGQLRDDATAMGLDWHGPRGA